MSAVKVPVLLPAWMWGRLATIAEHRNVRVVDLIEEGIAHILDSDPDRLAELNSELQKNRIRNMKKKEGARSGRS